MLNYMANVLNSGEFISSDRGFTASMTLILRDIKGGKNPNYRPGEKIWQEVVKEMRCVYEVKKQRSVMLRSRHRSHAGVC